MRQYEVKYSKFEFQIYKENCTFLTNRQFLHGHFMNRK